MFLESYSKSLKSHISEVNMISLVLFAVESTVCWILVFLASRNMAKVQSANLQMVAMLSNIRKEDVKKVRDRCSSFFLTHLAEYFDASISEILETPKRISKKKNTGKHRSQQDPKLQTEAKDNCSFLLSAVVSQPTENHPLETKLNKSVIAQAPHQLPKFAPISATVASNHSGSKAATFDALCRSLEPRRRYRQEEKAECEARRSI